MLARIGAVLGRIPFESYPIHMYSVLI
jgi:hypothetical protein